MTDITAKIAAILSPSEVALNVGGNSGVEKDDTGYVYETREIRDPDTKEALGEVRLRKLDLLISSVQEKLSIAVVTTYQDSGLKSGAATVRRRKRITDDPSEERKGEIVLVFTGEPVVIKHENKPAVEEFP